MITLECGKQRWTVTEERATSILKIQKAIGGAWSLPVNYELSKDGTIIRTNKTTGKGRASEERDSQRDMASEPTEVSHGDSITEG